MIMDEIQWIIAGEGVKAEVANRPLKSLVEILDNNNSLDFSSSQGLRITLDLKDGVVSSGDFVYYDTTAGLFKRTLGGVDGAKVHGCITYTNTDDVTLYFGGILDDGIYVKNDTYYLSSTEEGKLTNVNYDGAIEVGVAISDSQLLLTSSYISGSSTSSLSGDDKDKLDELLIVDVVAGSGVILDKTDPKNPIINISTNEIVNISEDFTATDSQIDFVLSNNILTSAKVYKDGIRIKSDEFSVSDDGTDTTISISDGVPLNTWILIES